MLPNEILPAIPRQKVRHIETGDVFYVIGLHPTEKQWVMLLTMDGFKDEAPLGNLQPVPEEPRPFRCGDAVCVQGTFCRITAVNDGSYRTTAGMGWVHEADGNIRHATPEELKLHF